MQRPMAIVFVAVTLLSAAVHAQEYPDDVCPARPKADKRAQKWAGRWFAKGEQIAEESRYQEALDAFLCSLSLYPHQNTVFNVAQLTNLVEDKAKATESLEKYREENPKGEFDGELADLIVSLEKAQGLETAEKPAAATIEGPPAAVETTSDPRGDSIASSAKDEGDGRKIQALRNAGFITIGAAGAALAVGIALQAMAGEAKKDAEESTSYDAYRKSEDDMNGRQAGATAMYVVTGVLAGTGAIMIVFGRAKKEKGTSEGVEVSAKRGPSGVALTGRF